MCVWGIKAMNEFIVEMLIAAVIIYLGYRIAFKYDIKLVHGYHYNNVLPTDKIRFCRLLGIGNFIIGFGIMLIAVLGLFVKAEAVYWLGTVIILLGALEEAVVVIKFNGSLFGRIGK